jgi:hypothetical protein
MVLEAPGWVLEVEDRTTHVAIRKVLTYGAGASYTQGEWLQEDPTSAIVVATDLPYPATSTVHFERLEVNGAHPRLPLDDGQTLMATGGIDLTPTPLTHDAFSMVRPGPAGEQYLADAARLDGALSSYDVELSSWASAPIAARTSDITVLLRAYAHFDLSLESQVWPLPARPALQVLVQQNGQIVGACRNWEATGLGLGTPAFAEVQGAVARASSDAARADLGLAPA